MIVHRLEVERFGCLHDFVAEFEHGLNVVRGPNESGKSTLHQALLMALTALPNQNKTTAAWCSWDTDGWYRLTLDFCDHNGESYRLVKDFEGGSQELRLPDGQTTRNRDTIDATLAEVLGTASPLMLRSTVCVEQDALADISNGRKEIAQSLETVVTGSEDDVYTAEALKRLERTISAFRVGWTRQAQRPGPLAKARDEQSRLEGRVASHRASIRDLQREQRALLEAEDRLAEIEAELAPLRDTLEQYERAAELQDHLAQWQQTEWALENRVREARTLQDEVNACTAQLADHGPVAQLSETDVLAVTELHSRLATLREEQARYATARERYQEELTLHNAQKARYEADLAAYSAAKQAYDEAHARYRRESEAYEAAMAQYEHDLAAYQEVWEPYEAARDARQRDEEQYVRQLEVYESAFARYETEMAAFEEAKRTQEQRLAEYDRAYFEFEEQLAKYEEQRAAYERRRDAYDEAQRAYQEAMSAYERAVSAAQQESGTQTPVKTGTISTKTILLAAGGIAAAAGVALLVLAGSVVPGAVVVGIGLLLLLLGLLRKAPARPQPEPSGSRSNTARLEKPEPPSDTRPEPPAQDRPKPPQRPQLEPLTQPQAPTQPAALTAGGEELQVPAIERPERPRLEKPVAPTLKQPDPPMPPPAGPVEPTFDHERLEALRLQLETKLDEYGCTSVAELNTRFAEVATLHSKQQRARSRLEGLVGGSTVAALEEQRQRASRERRDQQERLAEPQLKRVSQMSVLEYNRHVQRVRVLEAERDARIEQRQRARVILEQQPVSVEELLRAEEALEAATAAYERAQERFEVYNLTFELLSEARTRTLKQAQARLGPQTATYLKRLTAGRYQKAWISPDLEVELEDTSRPGRRIQPTDLSRGAQDQLYMAARLALVDLLFPAAMPPILLDDPFVHFDPVRLASAIDMLSDVAAARQVLLFTCSDNYNHVGHHIVMAPVLARNS